MTEPRAPRLCGQLWKSMVLEGWIQKKIPETTKDAFLVVWQPMFFVFTWRNVNCGALLDQLKGWFDYQQRGRRINLNSGTRSRLKTRWYIWPWSHQPDKMLQYLLHCSLKSVISSKLVFSGAHSPPSLWAKWLKACRCWISWWELGT